MKIYSPLIKLLFFIAISTSLTACKNKTIDEDVVLDIDTEIIRLDADLEVTVAEIINTTYQAEVIGTVTKKTYDENDILEECARVEKDSTYENQKIIINTTIDFGNYDCEGNDGRHRRGKIKVISVYETYPLVYLTSRKIETDEYYFKKDKINLKCDFQLNPSQLLPPKFSLSGDVKVIYFETNDSCYHSFSRTKTIQKGAETPMLLSDDEWLIEGSNSGYRKDGKNYESETIEPLVKTNCRVFDSGKINYSVEGEDDYEIDFGAGNNSECNSVVDITKNGETKVISIE
ncbi:MAG: hypothetical protein CMP63_00555 [Flavobacteriales bacterium]|nr:hypothetical protein [Flavobacteriales bacterium]